MADEPFGIDLSSWATLTPAQRSVLTRLFMRRAHVARNRAIGKSLLLMAGEASERLCALTWRRLFSLPRGARNRPRLAPLGKDS